MQPVAKKSALMLTMGLIMVGCNSSTTPVSPVATIPVIKLTHVKSLNQGVALSNNSNVFAVSNPTFKASATPGGSNQITEFQYQIDNGARVDIKNNTAFNLPLTTTGEYELKLFAKDNKGLAAEPYKVNLFVDATPATVNVAAPVDGQIISGKTVQFTLTAEDQDSNVTLVSLKNTVGAELCKSNTMGKQVILSCSVDVSGYADGNTPFTVQVTNGVGAVMTKTINTTVKNNPEEVPPVVKISKIEGLSAADAVGKTFSGTVQVYVDAQDINGVKSVELLVNGNPMPAKTSAPYIFSVDTTAYDNGDLDISAKATNTLDKTAQAANINVKVDNVVPPIFSISSPSNNAVVSGAQSVQVLFTKRNSNFDVVGDTINVEFYDYRGALVDTKTIAGVKDSANGTYATVPFDFSNLIDDWYTVRAYTTVNVLREDNTVASTQTLDSTVRVTASTISNNPPAVVILSPWRVNAAETELPEFVNGLTGMVLANLSDDVELGSAELRLTCDSCNGSGPQNALMEHKNLTKISSTTALFNFDFNGTPYLPDGDYSLRIKAQDNSTTPKSNIQELKVRINRSLPNTMSVAYDVSPNPSGIKIKFNPYGAKYELASDLVDTNTYMAIYYVVNPEGDLSYKQVMGLGKDLELKKSGISVIFNKEGTWTFGGQIQDLTTKRIYPLDEVFQNVVSAE